MHVRLWVVLLCLASLLTGCVSVVRGEPNMSPEVAKIRERANGRLDVRDALGDLRTVDYCSLVEEFEIPEGMGAFGRRPDPHVRYCWFSVLNGVPRMGVSVGYLDVYGHRRPPGPMREGSLRVAPGEESASTCERFVVFPDGLSLTVRTRWDGQTGLTVAERKKALCQIGDTAADDMVTSLVEGRARAVPDLDEKSLLPRDVCTVVPWHVLRKAGVSVVVARRYPDGHDCSWYDEDDQFAGGVFLDTSDTSVDHYFARGEEVTVAGRPSVLQHPDGYKPSCTITTAYADYPDDKQQWEEITVQVAGAGREACRTAKRVAAKVWPMLPEDN